MIRRTQITRLFAAAVAALAISGTARAGIIPVSVTVTPEADNFRWTYAIVLPTDMKLQSGDYFTIYDFGGLVAGSQFASPAGDMGGSWEMSSANTGPIPVGLNPNDDVSVPNLTFKYTGPTIPTGQLGLGNFGASSTVGTNSSSEFTAQNRQVSTGELDRNIVDTFAPGTPDVPPPPSGVPEPTTLALAGIGLPLLAAARRFRSKK
jgi:hypothetical protein